MLCSSVVYWFVFHGGVMVCVRWFNGLSFLMLKWFVFLGGVMVCVSRGCNGLRSAVV